MLGLSSRFHVDLLAFFEQKQPMISDFGGPSTVDQHVGWFQVAVNVDWAVLNEMHPLLEENWETLQLSKACLKIKVATRFTQFLHNLHNPGIALTNLGGY